MSYDYDWCGHDGCGAPIERWSREWKHRNHELDADHKAVPQQPIGPMEEGLHMRATRYAEALAAATAADERIAAMTELLVQHEYYRSQAEQTLSMVQQDPQFGTMWTPTGHEPDEGVAALLCLTTGTVYRRRQYGTGWQRAEHNPSTATGYEWPIQDAGPFIAWSDAYGFDAVLRQARKDQTEFDALHRKLYAEPGYRDESSSSWGRPPLAQAIDRIFMARSRKWSEQIERTHAAERKLAQLRRSIENLTPDDTQQWPQSQDSDEVRDVAVIDLDRVHDLLDRPEHGGAA